MTITTVPVDKELYDMIALHATRVLLNLINLKVILIYVKKYGFQTNM
jgi:hypothetical protein